MALVDLCTVADVVALDPGLANAGSSMDTLIAQLVTDASEALMAWTGRRYAPASPVASVRLVEATGVALVGTPDMAEPPTLVRVLDVDQVTVLDAAPAWTPQPVGRDASEPVTALRFTSAPAGVVEVTARWGWPAVPARARRACVITVMQWLRDTRALTRQSPDQFEPGSPPQRALPIAAMDLLRWDRVPVVA